MIEKSIIEIEHAKIENGVWIYVSEPDYSVENLNKMITEARYVIHTFPKIRDGYPDVTYNAYDDKVFFVIDFKLPEWLKDLDFDSITFEVGNDSFVISTKNTTMSNIYSIDAALRQYRYMISRVVGKNGSIELICRKMMEDEINVEV